MEKKQQSFDSNEESQRLAAIFEYSQDGIITITRRGTVERINPAAAKLFGYSPEEVIGHNVNILMPEPFHGEHDGYIANYHSSGEKKIIGIGREVKGQRKDGSVFPFFLSVSEVKLEDTSIYTGFIHDLSEQKKVEQEIRELNQSLENKVSERTEELSETVNKLLLATKELELEIAERKKAEDALRQSKAELKLALEKEMELNELKSRFVSMASHEFRTPLSTILSSTALIGRYTETGQQEQRIKHINRIKSAVNNLTGILNDFLSLSKLEEGKTVNTPVDFDMNVLCEEVIDEMKGLLKPGQHILHTHQIPKSRIRQDRRLLKNVLFNLLSNAIKYSDEKQAIYCSIEVAEGELVMRVRDEGIGIPEKDQVHLFSRFFRAANVTNIQGTGLGLNIVKNHVELMKGRISFESEEGKGSTFTIVFPYNPIDL